MNYTTGRIPFGFSFKDGEPFNLYIDDFSEFSVGEDGTLNLVFHKPANAEDASIDDNDFDKVFA